MILPAHWRKPDEANLPQTAARQEMSEQMDMARELEIRFTYHAPKEGQPEKYTRIRDTAKSLATLIVYESPACREQSLALTALEEAVMWANAAIVRRA